MSNDRTIASGILTEAARLVSKEREGHGSVEESFTMIAEMWSTYITHVIGHNSGVGRPIPEIHLSARDVAMMMADLKKARAVYGDWENRDNFVDSAGYLALAGMLSMRVAPVKFEGSGLTNDPVPTFLVGEDQKKVAK